MLKFIAGLFILFIAFLLQFLFASAGVFVNLSFAALISLGFLFGFWEAALFVVIAVFITNWQPTVSPEILVYALFPIAAYLSRDLFHLRGWLQNGAAIAVGFVVLALAASGPAALTAHWQPILMDIAVGELFGAIVFLPLYRVGRP